MRELLEGIKSRFALPRMQVLCVMVSVVCVFVFYTPVLSYQFEDYEWGKPKTEIINKLNSESKEFVLVDTENSIAYQDKILGYDCYVSLQFTPLTNKLSLIGIGWTDRSVMQKIKSLLSNKYGDPAICNDQRCMWMSDESRRIVAYRQEEYFKQEQILLEDKITHILLTYAGGEYFDLFSKEEEQLLSQESTRF